MVGSTRPGAKVVCVEQRKRGKTNKLGNSKIWKGKCMMQLKGVTSGPALTSICRGGPRWWQIWWGDLFWEWGEGRPVSCQPEVGF